MHQPQTAVFRLRFCDIKKYLITKTPDRWAKRQNNMDKKNLNHIKRHNNLMTLAILKGFTNVVVKTEVYYIETTIFTHSLDFKKSPQTLINEMANESDEIRFDTIEDNGNVTFSFTLVTEYED